MPRAVLTEWHTGTVLILSETHFPSRTLVACLVPSLQASSELRQFLGTGGGGDYFPVAIDDGPAATAAAVPNFAHGAFRRPNRVDSLRLHLCICLCLVPVV